MHRLALLHDPEYAHLVVLAPDGALVACCEVAICRREWVPGAPRMGWIEYVGTREVYQGRRAHHAHHRARQRVGLPAL
jgi:hypothetical protein